MRNSLLKTTMEAVASNVSDKSIALAIQQVGEIRRHFLNNEMDKMDLEILKLEKNLTSRFGIPFKFIDSSSEDMGYYSVSYSILSERTGFELSSDYLVELMEDLNWYKENKGTVNEILMGEDELRDLNAIGEYANRPEVKRSLESIKRFTLFFKSPELNKIVIDNKRAYISGLPADYDCNIAIPWKISLDEKSSLYATNREIVAVILHEIGHVYNRINYLYKSRNAILTIEESFREISNMKTGKGHKFILAYNNAADGKINADKYKSSSLPVAYLAVLKDVSQRFLMDGNDRAKFEVEAQADNFASRFGLGDAISSYLYRHHDYFDLRINPLILPSIMVITIGAGIFFPLMAVFAATFGMMILGIWIIRFVSNFVDAPEGDTYQSPYGRAERVLIDSIRQLRIYSKELTDKEKKSILRTADNIKEILTKMKNAGWDTRDIKEKPILEFLFKSLKNKRELYEFSDEIEKLMENPLHADIHRF